MVVYVVLIPLGFSGEDSHFSRVNGKPVEHALDFPIRLIGWSLFDELDFD
jgi:hypothetical protein